MSEVCNRKFTLSPECRTDDAPEILVWGDSFAMHLVQGIRSSNPDAKIIQFTKSICGPFFDIAPVIGSKYPVSWAESCLDFSAEVRSWLKQNTTVKFAVLSSPFRGYLSKDNKLLSRSGNLAPASEELVVKEFEKTLQELVSMGITPIVFSPPPENGTNIGRCLAKADWFGFRPEECNYEIGRISQTTKDVYTFLEIVEQKHAVVRIDDMICDDSRCHAYLDETYIYRDERHLSNEGSVHLGRKYNFYRLITQS